MIAAGVLHHVTWWMKLYTT